MSALDRAVLNASEVEAPRLREYYRSAGYSSSDVEELVHNECEHRQWMREFDRSVHVYDAVVSGMFAAFGVLLCACLLFADWPATPHWTAGIAGVYTGTMLGNLVCALRQLDVPWW